MGEPQTEGGNLSQHLWVSCPKCLAAEPEGSAAHIWGRPVLCKHCGEHSHSSRSRSKRFGVVGTPDSATARSRRQVPCRRNECGRVEQPA